MARREVVSRGAEGGSGEPKQMEMEMGVGGVFSTFGLLLSMLKHQHHSQATSPPSKSFQKPHEVHPRCLPSLFLFGRGCHRMTNGNALLKQTTAAGDTAKDALSSVIGWRCLGRSL